MSKRVLLVEHSIIAWNEAERLKKRGYEPVLAATGADAMRILLGNIGQFDLVLLGRSFAGGRSSAEVFVGDADRMRSVIDGTPALVAIMGLGGELVLANRRYEDLNWSSYYRFARSKAQEQYPIEIARRFQLLDCVGEESGLCVETEKFEGHPDGKWRSYLTARVPIRDGELRLLGAVAISLDLGECPRDEDIPGSRASVDRSLFDGSSGGPVLVEGTAWPTLDFAV
jgi:hypothetical protein